MIHFRPVTIEDKQWITPIFRQSGRMEAEYTFGNLFIWQKAFHIVSAHIDGCYVSKNIGKRISYGFPIGNGDKKMILEELRKDAGDQPFVLHGINKDSIEQLNLLYPNQFNFIPIRDSFDYLYETEKLITLSGKKLHGKRNHLNRFMENNWSYEPITGENISLCKEMSDDWYRLYSEQKDDSLEEEKQAVSLAFANFEQLGLAGGLIKVDGKIVAYTMGEPINDKAYNIHIEKAYAEINGAYTAINQQFLKNHCASYLYVNREEDMGQEGLRKAKLSYHPYMLLEKYDAIFKG